MSYQNCAEDGQSFSIVCRSFLQADGLPFSDVLSEEVVEQAFQEEDALFGQEPGGVYTPALTLWAFLSQVIQSGAQRSCNAAVDRIRTLCVLLGIRAPSPDSGAYCRARAKLSEGVLQRLTYHVADELEQQLPREWLWYGRHVFNVDGTTVTASDTPRNQAAWPQPASQQPGLGFPLLRICALMSMVTGAIHDLAFGPYQGKETGETALLRTMFDRLRRGNVVLGDAYFCSYFMIALLKERGVDVVFRQHQRRRTDFRTGKRLGPLDHTVRWRKPPKPAWMDQETYDRMPDKLKVRELAVDVAIPGFRVQRMILVTTLTNARQYPTSALADLFRKRWHAEIDLRSIKVHMNMEDLRGKKPEIVRREIWAHCLAYNLIRKTMAQAAYLHERTVRDVSFCGALQALAGMVGQTATVETSTFLDLARTQLASIVTRQIGNRPDRVEPRAIKRRPKDQKLLTTPRAQARTQLLITPESAA
jgi:putative transposase